MTREEAITTAAKLNTRYLTEEDYEPECGLEYWAIVLEFGDTDRSSGGFNGMVEGGVGVLDGRFSRIFRVVKPTAEEFAIHCSTAIEQGA